jgi:hypothetical protein
MQHQAIRCASSAAVYNPRMIPSFYMGPAANPTSCAILATGGPTRVSGGSRKTVSRRVMQSLCMQHQVIRYGTSAAVKDIPSCRRPHSRLAARRWQEAGRCPSSCASSTESSREWCCPDDLYMQHQVIRRCAFVCSTKSLSVRPRRRPKILIMTPSCRRRRSRLAARRWQEAGRCP